MTDLQDIIDRLGEAFVRQAEEHASLHARVIVLETLLTIVVSRLGPDRTDVDEAMLKLRQIMEHGPAPGEIVAAAKQFIDSCLSSASENVLADAGSKLAKLH